MNTVSENRILHMLHQQSQQGLSLRLSQPYSTSAIKAGSSIQLVYPSVEANLQPRHGESVELISHTFGLSGAIGALPYAYTEFFAQKTKEKEFAIQGFLNIFNHRAVTLLYESWMAQQWIDSSLLEQGPLRRKPRAALLAYSGVDLTATRNLSHLSFWGHLMNHAGVFSRRTRTASGLVSVLKNQFQLQVHVEQFVGKWFEISPIYRCRLSSGRDAFQLGINTSLGKSTLNLQTFFKVHLYITSTAQYRDLAPGSEQIKLMQKLIKSYVGEELRFQLVIHITAGLIPRKPLSKAKASGVRVGWNSMVGIAPPQKKIQLNITRDYSRN